MPTGMLLRSLLVSTISSNRFLLIPTLSFLSFLSKPGRSFLLNVDRNPILHAILRKGFYDQFCAGESERETKACVQRFKDLGFRGFILTYAKETLFDHYAKAMEKKNQDGVAQGVAAVEVKDAFDQDVENWKKGTLATGSMVGEGDILAIKLTGAGIGVSTALAAREELPKRMKDALNEILESCANRNVRVIIDAESQYFQKGIDDVAIEMMSKFNRNGTAVIYNTYQAYLKNTTNNILGHMERASKEGFTLGLKLVRGAYILSETRSLIHDTKEDTDNAYNAISQSALRQELGEFGSKAAGARPFPSLNLLLATHNRASVIAAQRLHFQRTVDGLPTVPVAYAQLHGMSDEVSFSLLQEKKPEDDGPEVYKCSTWGTLGECLAYLLRRAVENRDAVLRTKDEHRAVKAECWRRFKGVFTA
ncbi:proline dehydrogenase [Stachybotrys elegans]|uniref:Proline dehydrogenase n=1 Tax=Stachybotrys elegans TaxID=80388 RepID=A0A8K0SMK5_9HYPO|nr:proline dehydrogenase [Stachybotrys elegans]